MPKAKNKKVLSVTVDADLYDKIDMICEIQRDTRSGFVERALHAAVQEKEEALADMESPTNRLIFDMLSKSPDRLIHMVMKLIGEKVTAEDLERIRKNTPLLAEEGKRRQQLKKKGGKKNESGQ